MGNPLYLILQPTKDGFREVARFWGEIKDPGQFIEFLGKPKTEGQITFEAELTPRSVKPGQIVTLTIKGTPGPKYHTYPLTERAPEQEELQLSKLEVLETIDLKPLWPVRESEGEFVLDGGKVLLEHKIPFTWTQEVLVNEEAKPGESTLPFSIRAQVCDTGCLWGTHYFSVPLTVK